MSEDNHGQSPQPNTPIEMPEEQEVGYRKPPRAHAFKPGKSGNPKGRPRGAKNEATILREVLDRMIEARNNGRRRKISIREAILQRLTEGALRGDIKNAAFLLNRDAAQAAGSLQTEGMNDDDKAVLRAYAERLLAQPLDEETTQ